ncbi:MAG: hypothetical protein ACLFS6_01650 [Methanomassiliicoccales archaeon]
MGKRADHAVPERAIQIEVGEAGPDSLTSPEVLALLQEIGHTSISHVEWVGGRLLERGDWADLLHRSHLLELTNHLWVHGRELLDPCLSRRVVDLTPGGTVVLHIGPEDREEHLKGLERLLEVEKPAALLQNRIPAGEGSLESIRETVEMIGSLGIPSFVDGHIPPLKRRMRDCPGPTMLVDDEGFAHPCYPFRWELGNVREEGLMDLTDRVPRTEAGEGCSGCLRCRGTLP